jgi:hypothetical protein
LTIAVRYVTPLLISFLALAVACGGSGDDDSVDNSVDDQPLPAGTVTAETAVAAVNEFDPAAENPVLRLNQVVQAGGDFVSDLAPMLEDTRADPNQRWAALYLVALMTDTEEEIAVLTPVLQDDDEIFRVMAAGSLAGLGVTESLPVLIEGLSSEADLPFSEPPRPLGDYARATLENYTGESFEDAGDWEDWWDEVESDITWDGEQYVAS